MGKIYVGQTALKLILDVQTNITGATMTIKYKKPDLTEGEFSSNITATNEAEGVIEWEPADENDIDMSGEWTFWAYAVFNNGKEAAGEPIKVRVYNEGSDC